MEVLETKKLHRIVYSPILKAEVLDMFKIGFWITCMFALRNISIGFPHHLAAETYQQMSTESLGWIPCLTSPDPYMIIPLAAGLISLTNIEFLKRYYYRNGIRSPYVVGLFRLSAVLLTEMMCYFPTNLSLYWLSFGILNLSKNVLIRQPSVKKLLKIPEIVAPTR
ncbi:Cytochrome c oxidase assembly protein COX18, mitochondrial [Halotydeus destructor]|nr:Cytochrome c oxidase assembly protein COX18, mitochondrial [Halotydeus destructor]